MATTRQIAAAKRNIVKAQAKWQSMSHRQHALAQPEGRGRAKPGTVGSGEYYRIVVRPRSEFISFRTQDVGDPGDLLRIAGKRSSGSWATQAWLVDKHMAHIEGDSLVADATDAKNLLAKLRGIPHHEKGDIFSAKDRRNVPEHEKPTAAPRAARSINIKKAQASRHNTHAPD